MGKKSCLYGLKNNGGYSVFVSNLLVICIIWVTLVYYTKVFGILLKKLKQHGYISTEADSTFTG